eukprot:COSAG01_NODE_13293_length_1605_cov_66.165339_2_plen_310_part_00
MTPSPVSAAARRRRGGLLLHWPASTRLASTPRMREQLCELEPTPDLPSMHTTGRNVGSSQSFAITISFILRMDTASCRRTGGGGHTQSSYMEFLARHGSRAAPGTEVRDAVVGLAQHRRRRAADCPPPTPAPRPAWTHTSHTPTRFSRFSRFSPLRTRTDKLAAASRPVGAAVLMSDMGGRWLALSRDDAEVVGLAEARAGQHEDRLLLQQLLREGDVVGQTWNTGPERGQSGVSGPARVCQWTRACLSVEAERTSVSVEGGGGECGPHRSARPPPPPSRTWPPAAGPAGAVGTRTHACQLSGAGSLVS